MVPSPSGAVVVDKPRGLSSHDVVARIRRYVRPSRAGHTGTLDPIATGVLVVCIGAATRLSRYLMKGIKEYSGEVVFGVSTDTYDAEGRVTGVRPCDDLDPDAIRSAARGLEGDVTQVPPPFSAKRVSGRRAYDLARGGMPVDLPACRVRVDTFEIIEPHGDRGRFRIVCSEGTYVRSLIHALGETLGCGAHVSALRRERNGSFTADEAVSLEALDRAGKSGSIEALIRPPETLDLGLQAVRITDRGALLASEGRVVPMEEVQAETAEPLHGMVRILTTSGALLGLAEIETGGSIGIQPRVVLEPGVPSTKRP